MRLFGWYLQTRVKGIAVFGLFCAVFAVVFGLYDLPTEAVLLGAAVCVLLGAVLFVADFASFLRRHRELERLKREVSLTLEHIPVPRGRLEEDYQGIIRTLCEDARRAAERSDARLAEQSEYYTVWAHQIKTPIAAMRLLLSEEDTPRNRELAEALQSIEQYVEMALGYVRLDSESTDYVIRRYDLDGLVCGAIRKYAAQFIRKKIRLNYAPFHREVLTDEKWLCFVLEQILSNALKYTRSGGSVTLTLEEPLTLAVSDTGIGIAPEDLPRVFEKGYTGCNGRADKRATGIGLYLSRRILEKLGHSISVTSEAGVGTTVRLRLDSADVQVE